MTQIVDRLLGYLGPCAIVLAEKGLGRRSNPRVVQDQDTTPNIPPKSSRCWKPCLGKRLYRERNLIKRFFFKIKAFCRIATRYDRLAANFLAMVQVAGRLKAKA
jgi:hypothetical protein